MVEDAGRQESGRDIQLAQTFAEVARALLAAGTLEETLRRISTLAVETIDGCDHAGVSYIEGHEVTTRAASDDIPPAVDQIQYQTNEGPCLDAMRDHEVLHVEDLSSDPRWPKFAPRAVEETGVRSMLSFRLFAEQDTMGALNLYSKTVGAFDEEAHAIGSVFATHASVAIAGARMSAQKDEAIRSRDVIGQAKGILMAQKNISEDEAFDILRRASQRMNIKLREVAERITERPGAS